MLHRARDPGRAARDADRYYADLPFAVVGPGVKTGIPIHTDNPREVGADRIVNALAAAELYGGPAIVVDLNGTATIFDVVDADNRYIGGAIAPGVELSLEALARRGAQLRSVELALPRDVIGKNTVEAIQSGLVFGFAGLVDGIVDAHHRLAGRRPRPRHGHRDRLVPRVGRRPAARPSPPATRC